MTEITTQRPAERLREAANRLDELADAGPDAMRHFGQTLDSTVGKALAAWLRDVAYALDRHPSPTVVPNGRALAVAGAILGTSD